MRLPCENIYDFINGKKHHYSVTTDKYQIGDIVTLYHNHKECKFRVMYILNFKEHKILHLLEESLYSREAIATFYAGRNPLD
jgi:hypothetical protein